MFTQSQLSPPIFNQPTTQPSMSVTPLAHSTHITENNPTYPTSYNVGPNASTTPIAPRMSAVLNNTTTDTTPMTTQIVVHLTPEEKDCQTALRDFKGKIQDIIQKCNNGKYKSGEREFFNSIVHLDIDQYAIDTLSKNMRIALENDPDIHRQNNTNISFNSDAYKKVLMKTLLAYKKQSGVSYSHNSKHPMRTRPNKKQRNSSYAFDKSKFPTSCPPMRTMDSTLPDSGDARVQPPNRQMSGITVDMIPTLMQNSSPSLCGFGNTNSIVNDSSVQYIEKIRSQCDEILRMKSHYDNKLLSLFEMKP